MASRSRDGDKPLPNDIPQELPNVTPPSSPMMDHSFTLQAIMEVQKTVSSLDTKVGRLIDDVGKQGATLDDVRHKVSFVKGVIWVLGFLLVALSGLTIALITGEISISVQP